MESPSTTFKQVVSSEEKTGLVLCMKINLFGRWMCNGLSQYPPGCAATTAETHPNPIMTWLGPIISRMAVDQMGHSTQFNTPSACHHQQTSHDIPTKIDMELCSCNMENKK